MVNADIPLSVAPIRQEGVTAKDKSVEVIIPKGTVFWLPETDATKTEPLTLVNEHEAQFIPGVNIKIGRNHYQCVVDWEANDNNVKYYPTCEAKVVLPKGIVVRLQNRLAMYLADDVLVNFTSGNQVLIAQDQKLIQSDSDIKMESKTPTMVNIVFQNENYDSDFESQIYKLKSEINVLQELLDDDHTEILLRAEIKDLKAENVKLQKKLVKLDSCIGGLQERAGLLEELTTLRQAMDLLLKKATITISTKEEQYQPCDTLTILLGTKTSTTATQSNTQSNTVNPTTTTKTNTQSTAVKPTATTTQTSTQSTTVTQTTEVKPTTTTPTTATQNTVVKPAATAPTTATQTTVVKPATTTPASTQSTAATQTTVVKPTATTPASTQTITASQTTTLKPTTATQTTSNTDRNYYISTAIQPTTTQNSNIVTGSKPV